MKCLIQLFPSYSIGMALQERRLGKLLNNGLCNCEGSSWPKSYCTRKNCLFGWMRLEVTTGRTSETLAMQFVVKRLRTCHRFLVRGQRISAIAAIAADGLVSCEVYTQSVDSDIFFDFIRGNLIPQMNIII